MTRRIRPGLLAEVFAGSAALTRCAVGAPMDLLPWLGSKRRVAHHLLRAAGYQPGCGAEAVLLCDAGTWGWVWPVLLDAELRAGVVGVLRRWSRECPACQGSGMGLAGAACSVCVRAQHPGGGPDASDLWRWLASQPPRVELVERVAGWMWLQARSASGAPVWWDADRAALVQGSAEGRPAQPAGERNSGWLKGPRPGREQEAAAEMGWRMGREPKTIETNETGRSLTQKGQSDDILARPRPSTSGQQVIGRWIAQHGHGGPQAARERDTWATATRAPSAPTCARGIVYPATLAERLEALGRVAFPPCAVLHGSAEEAAELVASWCVLQAGNGRGKPVEVRGGRWSTAGFAHLTDACRAKGFTERIHLPRVVARLDALGQHPFPPTGVLAGSAEEAAELVVDAGADGYLFLDPPYHRDGDQARDRTGYGWDLPLERTLALSARAADAGVFVQITEGGPLDGDLGPGWYAYKTNHLYSGQVKGEEWVTQNAPTAALGEPRQTTLAMSARTP